MLGMDTEPGIYLRTLTDLFQAIEEARDHADCSVSMSYLEVSLPAGLLGDLCPWGVGILLTVPTVLCCSCPTAAAFPPCVSPPRFITK